MYLLTDQGDVSPWILVGILVLIVLAATGFLIAAVNYRVKAWSKWLPLNSETDEEKEARERDPKSS